ncbi:MAG TPA: hypothetical protein VKC15_08815 [Gemmatimonadales bacterium]|nr:hypothetical protein [Gemmatimonadales bacterium]
MPSAARAIAWEFRQRHRWGLVALAAYFLVLATIKLLIPESSLTFNMDSGERFAVVVMVPLTATFLYLLTVFSFGLSGDVAGRQSMYPARMFTLPVSPTALTVWPMLYGAAAMAMLWLATRFLAVWPSGFDIPVIWPALAAVSLLAWTQALTWMPYGLPGLRVILAVLWLGTVDSIVILALRYQASEAVMVAIVAPQIPLAFLAARFAVGRARRGDVPDWRGVFARGQSRPQAPRPFASPARAQAWFEWRRHGGSLPAVVGILLPFELALLWLARDAPAFVFEILFLALITPPFMAAFTGWTVNRPNPQVRDSYGVPPFVATRPLTSAELIAAKLKMALWSTLAAWLVVLVVLPLALEWSGTWPLVAERVRRMNNAIGTPRAATVVLLILAVFIVATWKQLVQSLHIGLTGRAWIVKGSVLLTLTFLILLGPIVEWIIDTPSVQRALWNALPQILAALVGLKMSTAAWIATRLDRSRLLGDRALVLGAACWCVAVLALYAVLVWFFSTPFVARYVLALIAILAVPLARISAAPLALAWNRHR